MDSLLNDVNAEKRGITAYCGLMPVEVFNSIAQPKLVMTDIYPLNTDSGWQQLTFQGKIDSLCSLLDSLRKATESLEKELYYVPQAFGSRWKGSWMTNWVTAWYNPSPSELSCFTYLGLAYGVDGICHFRYESSVETTWLEPPNYRIDEMWGLVTPYPNYQPTPNWNKIHDIAPKVKKYGSIIVNSLEWEGACKGEDVGAFVQLNFEPSYIKEINCLVGAHGIRPQVGFFSRINRDYFMLVERACDDPQYRCTSFSVVFDINVTGAKNIRDMYTDSIVDAISGERNSIIIPLSAGEGKMFKLEDPDWYGGHITSSTNWGGVINLRGDIIIDSGVVLSVNPGTIIYVFPGDFQRSGIDTAKCELIVKGTLKIQGVTNDSIRFTAQNETQGSWYGIRVLPGGNCKIKYTLIKDALNGVILSGSASDTLSNCRLYRNLNYGIVDSNSNARIQNCLIEKNSSPTPWSGTGILLANVNSGLNASLSSNTIKYYGTGIYAENCSTVVAMNTIYNAGITGISAKKSPYFKIADCNAYGQYGQNYMTIDSTYSVIYHCDLNGSRLEDPSKRVRYGIKYFNSLTSNLRNTKINNADTSVYCRKSQPDIGNANYPGDNCFSRLFPADDNYRYYVYEDTTAGKYIIQAKMNYYSNPGPRVKGFFPDTFTVLKTPWEGHDCKADGEGQIENFGFGKLASLQPLQFEVNQNYPNPFNPITIIDFAIPEESRVTIKVYNILGQVVNTLLDEVKSPGNYRVNFNGVNNKGEQLASGIYFYKIEAGDFREVKKMVLLR